MTKKDIVSIVIGLVFSTIINGLVYYILFLETLDLFGMDSIIDPEKRHAKIFYTALILTTTTIVGVIVLFWRKRKFSAIGVGIPALLGFLILMKIGVTYLDKSSYYEPFNGVKWKQTTEKPVRMARLLIKNNELIGLTPNQVIDKLGKGDFSNDGKFLIYEIDENFCQMALMIENNKVAKSVFWIND